MAVSLYVFHCTDWYNPGFSPQLLPLLPQPALHQKHPGTCLITHNPQFHYSSIFHPEFSEDDIHL